MRTIAWLGAVFAGGAVFVLSGEREARACGGCMHEPVDASKVVSTITAHRMIFSISSTQTTLYDEIQFSGTPTSFAWVLPIKGSVSVGLSADILFATIDALTAITVHEPPRLCGGGGGSGGSKGSGTGGSSGSGTGGSKGTGPADSGVTIITQQQVGPYETVQLASKDGSALTNWLTANGYALTAADAPVIAAYVAAGMNFLALKLVPGAGVSAMQPVRITTAGAFPVLPLRMVGVGTGPTTSITLWIVADARWEPKNFPFFTIANTDLTWNWSTLASNYEPVRLANEAALGGGGWQVESSLDLSQYSVQEAVVTNVALDGDAGGGYLPPPDGGAGFDASVDAGADGGPPLLPVETDLMVLFAGIKTPNARITRLRTDIAHSALANDLILQPAIDPSEVSNQLTPIKQSGPGCPYFPDGGAIDSGAGGSAGTGVGGSAGSGGGGGAYGTSGTMGTGTGSSGTGSSGTGSSGTGAGGKGGAGGHGGHGGHGGAPIAEAGPDAGDASANQGGCSTSASSPSALDVSGGALLAMLGLRAVGARARRRRERRS